MVWLVGTMTLKIICNLMERANCDRDLACHSPQNPGYGDVNISNFIQNLSHKVFWMLVQLVTVPGVVTGTSS